jgi:hypothetical protein
MICACGQHRTPQGCGGARALKARSPELRREHGRLGGNAHAAKWHARLVTRFNHLRRADAIVAAYQVGLHTRKLRQWRAKRQAAA